MDTLVYKGKLDRYLKAPLYLIALLAAGDIWLFTIDYKVGVVVGLIVILYAILVWVMYKWNQQRLNEAVVNFATRYGTVQKEMLYHLEVPYALLDVNGRFLWENAAFHTLCGEEAGYQKSITSLFGEINKDVLEKTSKEDVEIRLEWLDHLYRIELKQLHIEHSEGTKEVSGMNLMLDSVIAVMMYDETDITALKQKNLDQQLVSGLIYIDNYEETIESVESVRRSLLTALVDRKINKYFQSLDAIVRKIERDKYFVVFPHKFLEKMESNKFAILEDVKTIKSGNENEVTLSIGIGVGGDSYIQNAEYARTAIDQALGRGGAQAVIKNGSEVSYYGSRGKEIERNTRVKARVKAQALREIMSTRDRILVMGHQLSDVDVFGSAIGIYVAARELGKEAKIVLNTTTSSLRPLVEMFNTEAGYPEKMIINNEEAIAMCDQHTLVVVVDTNRPSYTECPQLLDISKHVVVFDHHRHSGEVVENPVLSYIEPYASSACEMIAEMLQYFSEKVELRPAEADCIYAGIIIDTNNFVTKTGVRTFEAAAYLRRSGSDVTRVRKLLRENMDVYKARAEVVRHAQVYRSAFAISECDTREVESPTIVGAQAANELLNIVGIKASFVLTTYKNKIYISSRSIDEINVQLIMERLGGGGHLNIAGAQIVDSTIEEVKHKLTDILDDLLEEGEIKL